MLTKRNSSSKGQSLPLVIACAMFLVLGGVVVLKFGILFGGSQDVRNAVDAGALNLATHAVDVKVPPVQTYTDVSDTGGQMGLMNINRAIGKAMLINLNAESMQKSGQAGQSQQNAQLAVSDLQNMSQQLTTALNDPQFETSQFTKVSQPSEGGSNGSNTAGKGKVYGTPGFGTGYVHSGQSSNISLNQNQLPPQTNLPVQNSVPGYTPLNVNSSQFYFVPYKTGEKPHLISTDEFNSGKSPPTNWQAPIPNAVQGSGSLGPELGVQSVASAVINPQQTYQLSIPHAFIKISFQPTPVTWKVNGKSVANSTYQYTAVTQYEVKNYAVGCKSKLNGYASVGNEYKGNTVWAAINGVPGQTAHTQALADLTQRLAEIQPSFSGAQLQTLLMQQQLTPEVYDYILYPVYQTQDNSDPKIVVAPITSVGAGWFNSSAAPDGTAKSLGNESLEDTPNSNWGQVIGAWQLQSHHVIVSGTVNWTPGSGYNQCLGAVQFSRTAQATFNGQCPK